ncbi:restriction endonuclease [Aureimonas sp. Leaf324]|uniref:restriction endonuclease n=1 Tax=Aureimonas sp. Leaf324 TaxID=1736336 RepID=UPI0006F8E8D4|nr:restriction endonuclease [Aureimonas sp. Leaf324]KQQ85689.1 hypothetical protein ASF65_03835 [Aureimonas sp. Leaf324]
MSFSFPDVVGSPFLEVLAVPLATGALAVATFPLLGYLFRHGWLRRRWPVRIKLPNGRTEYLRGGDEAELRMALSEYLDFEKQVLAAIRDLQRTSDEVTTVEELEGAHQADFVLRANGRTYLVEAKLDGDSIDRRLLRRYFDARKADEIILVSKKGFSKTARERLGRLGGDRVQLLSASGSVAIRDQIARILVHSASR